MRCAIDAAARAVPGGDFSRASLQGSARLAIRIALPRELPLAYVLQRGSRICDIHRIVTDSWSE